MRRPTFQEVRSQVNIEDVPTQALDRVIEGKNVDTFAVFNIGALVNNSDVPKLHSKVVSGDLVHLDPSLFNIIGTKNDEDGVASLLSTAKIVNTNSRTHELQPTGQ